MKISWGFQGNFYWDTWCSVLRNTIQLVSDLDFYR